MKKYKVDYWIPQVEEGIKTITADNIQQAKEKATKHLSEYAAGCKYKIDRIQEVRSL